MISAERMKSVRIAPADERLLVLGPLLGRDRRLRVRGVRADQLPELLRALVAEVGAADHQDRREQPRQQLAEQQRGGQDQQQLVAQRADRDPLDHRQLALGPEPLDVARRDRGVVDDHAGGLHARPARAGGDVVDRGGGEAREGHDVVEERGETRAHRSASPRGARTVLGFTAGTVAARGEDRRRGASAAAPVGAVNAARSARPEGDPPGVARRAVDRGLACTVTSTAFARTVPSTVPVQPREAMSARNAPPSSGSSVNARPRAVAALEAVGGDAVRRPVDVRADRALGRDEQRARAEVGVAAGAREGAAEPLQRVGRPLEGAHRRRRPPFPCPASTRRRPPARGARACAAA